MVRSKTCSVRKKFMEKRMFEDPLQSLVHRSMARGVGRWSNSLDRHAFLDSIFDSICFRFLLQSQLEPSCFLFSSHASNLCYSMRALQLSIGARSRVMRCSLICLLCASLQLRLSHADTRRFLADKPTHKPGFIDADILSAVLIYSLRGCH